MSIHSRSVNPAPASANASLYTRAFRRKVHRLILMGYQRLDAPAFRGWDEPNISGELVRAMREALEAAEAPEWASRYAIHDDPPQHAKDRFGNARKRFDIALEATQPGRHAWFKFEAKRLRNGSSVEKYLGPSGLGCFLSGDYASECPMAGMLGYVQADSEGAWAGRIEARLGQSPAKYALRSDASWTKVRLVPGLEHAYETRHDRRDPLPSINISHILLLFC